MTPVDHLSPSRLSAVLVKPCIREVIIRPNPSELLLLSADGPCRRVSKFDVDAGKKTCPRNANLNRRRCQELTGRGVILHAEKSTAVPR